MAASYPRIPYGEAVFSGTHLGRQPTENRHRYVVLRSYLADPSLRRRYPSVQHLGLAMVFHGWELAAYEAVGDAGE